MISIMRVKDVKIVVSLMNSDWSLVWLDKSEYRAPSESRSKCQRLVRHCAPLADSVMRKRLRDQSDDTTSSHEEGGPDDLDWR